MKHESRGRPRRGRRPAPGRLRRGLRRPAPGRLRRLLRRPAPGLRRLRRLRRLLLRSGVLVYVICLRGRRILRRGVHGRRILRVL
ncbi:MAG: hypothetical protein ACLFPO_11820, partial [Spirochaetaceae bacterium]